MATYERLDYGSPDGSQICGTSTERLGFWGATPAVRQSVGNNISTATHASSLVSSIHAALVTIGLLQV